MLLEYGPQHAQLGEELRSAVQSVLLHGTGHTLRNSRTHGSPGLAQG